MFCSPTHKDFRPVPPIRCEYSPSHLPPHNENSFRIKSLAFDIPKPNENSGWNILSLL